MSWSNVFTRVLAIPLNGVPVLFKTSLAGKSAVHIAIEINSLEILEILVKAGGDVNAQTQSGDTALHIALKPGAGQDEPRGMVEYLLKNKVVLSRTARHKFQFFLLLA